MKITVNNAGALRVIKVASGAQGPQGPIGALNADDRAYVDAARASAAASETSAGDSAATATAAETSATASAAAALGSETASAASQAAAAGSATAASTSASQIASSYAAFQKLFLGDHPSDPSTDNQGNPLVEGATYFNDSMAPPRTRTFTGGVWVDSNKDAETATASAQLSAAAASGSASAALSSQTAAAASKAAADADVVTTGASKTAAAASAALAASWSAQAAGTVDGVNFSAKFYSLAASTSAGQASNSAAAAAASAAAASLFDPSNYVSKSAGGTFGAQVRVSFPNSNLILDTPANGQQASLYFSKGSVLRWAWTMDSGSETGGNTGSGMQLATYSDSGAYIFSAAVFDRATGALHLREIPDADGAFVWTQNTLPLLVDANNNVTSNATGKIASAYWPNTTFNGTGEFGDAGWITNSFAGVVGSFGEGTMFQNTVALTGQVVDVSEAYKISGSGVPMSISATLYTPGLSGAGAFAAVDIEWLDGSMETLGIGPRAVLAGGNSWSRCFSNTVESPVGCVYARTRKYIATNGVPGTEAATAFGIVFKDIKTERYNGSSSQSQEESIRSLNVPAGQCYLSLSGTNLLLSRNRGNTLTIGGRNRQIPAAGVTLAAPGTAANTLYYIYASWSEVAQSIVLNYATGGYAIDANTGLKIKSGEEGQTYVGMAYVSAAGQWTDTTAAIGVLSEFNRKGKTVTGANNGGATASGVVSYVALSLISHGDENIRVAGVVSGYVSAVNVTANAVCQLDTTQSIPALHSYTNASFFGSMAPQIELRATEGHHTAQLLAGGGALGYTFTGNAQLFVTTNG